MEVAATDASQAKAVRAYRKRLSQRGLTRFEVLGREIDRSLIRTLARRMADDDSVAVRLRDTVRQALTAKPHEAGGILAALRRSPLVGAELDFTREGPHGRSVEF